MTPLPSPLQAEIQKLLPIFRSELRLSTLDFVVRSSWSRADIREGVVAALPNLSETEREILRRLEFLPDPPEASVSISHTPTVGGFAFTLSHHPPIGFDLEDAGRVHAKAVARISRPDEVMAAPSPALLWCAKEAAFKALRGRPKVLSGLHARAWRSVANPGNLSLWSCEVREDFQPNGANTICRGLAVELSGTALAIFLSMP